MDDLVTMVEIAVDEMDVDVCSLYIREGDSLVMKATFGLETASVGQVDMPLHEGLTGAAYESGRPLSVSEPSMHPRYRYFPATGEENFRSYLGIPLEDGRGVLVFQTRDAHFYSVSVIRAAEHWAKRFANAWNELSRPLKMAANH